MRTIAIFCAGQAGDCLTISSVLRYREELWGDAKIVWYIADENRDLLKYQDVELRTFPRGFGYPVMVHEENAKLIAEGKEPVWEDWLPLVGENNHMNLELKNNYPSLADIDYGYFPAPHQIPVSKRHGWDYPVCSKKIFGVPDDREWHPVLNFSIEEDEYAYDFINVLPHGKRIMLETFAGSDQSKLSHEMVVSAMDICRERWPGCVFIFASHKYLRSQEIFPESLFERPDVFSCATFTVRQCSLIYNQCDLMISVSSGITVAASCWWNSKRVPILQFCGSFICSTKTLSNGHFELVTADNKTLDQAKEEFYSRLTSLLNQYK